MDGVGHVIGIGCQRTPPGMSLFELVLVVTISAIVLPLCIRGLVWRHVRERRLRVPLIDIVSETALPRSLEPVFRAKRYPSRASISEASFVGR